MPLKRKKTVRDQLEARLEDLVAQADVVRQQIKDRAPEVRDAVVTKAQHGAVDLADTVRTKAAHGAADLRERLPELRHELLERAPELSEKTYDKLPKSVADRLPDEVKPKKRRLRRIVGFGLVLGAGAAAFATLRGKQAPPPPPYQPTPAPAPAAPHSGTAPTADSLDAVDAPGTK
jgi:uncharacterized protein YdhG (YjbR/CyaY superfamily)